MQFLRFRKMEIAKILNLVKRLDLVFFYLETPSLTKADAKIIKVGTKDIFLLVLLILIIFQDPDPQARQVRIRMLSMFSATKYCQYPRSDFVVAALYNTPWSPNLSVMMETFPKVSTLHRFFSVQMTPSIPRNYSDLSEVHTQVPSYKYKRHSLKYTFAFNNYV